MRVRYDLKKMLAEIADDETDVQHPNTQLSQGEINRMVSARKRRKGQAADERKT